MQNYVYKQIIKYQHLASKLKQYYPYKPALNQ